VDAHDDGPEHTWTLRPRSGREPLTPAVNVDKAQRRGLLVHRRRRRLSTTA
jgi:hypothetical protein